MQQPIEGAVYKRSPPIPPGASYLGGRLMNWPFDSAGTRSTTRLALPWRRSPGDVRIGRGIAACGLARVGVHFSSRLRRLGLVSHARLCAPSPDSRSGSPTFWKATRGLLSNADGFRITAGILWGFTNLGFWNLHMRPPHAVEDIAGCIIDIAHC
jgi:hypothetical protein